MVITLLRLPSLLQRNGNSRTKQYNETAEGLWPPGVSIGKRSVAWPDYEVDTIIAARIAGKTDDEIRALVKKLVAARKTLV